MANLEKIYKTYFSGNPFGYFFADNNFNRQYISERRYGAVLTAASVWAIFIAQSNCIFDSGFSECEGSVSEPC